MWRPGKVKTGKTAKSGSSRKQPISLKCPLWEKKERMQGCLRKRQPKKRRRRRLQSKKRKKQRPRKKTGNRKKDTKATKEEEKETGTFQTLSGASNVRTIRRCCTEGILRTKPSRWKAYRPKWERYASEGRS